MGISIILGFLSYSFSLDYMSDTLAVRAILDTNGLDTVPVKTVIVDTSEGRIIDLNFDFDEHDLTTMPSEIGTLDALQKLNISTNSFSSIPKEIGKLKKLTDLTGSMFGNAETLPDEITHLQKLDTLCLPYNQISSLPQDFGHLEKLKYIRLYQNHLTQLPQSIIYLTPKVCDFGGNYLDKNNLSKDIIAWLNKYNPTWIHTQNVTKIMKDNKKNSQLITYSTETKTLQLSIPTINPLKLQIQLFNIQGQRVIEIPHHITPDMINIDLKAITPGSGVYYLKLNTKDISLGNKIILEK